MTKIGNGMEETDMLNMPPSPLRSFIHQNNALVFLPVNDPFSTLLSYGKCGLFGSFRAISYSYCWYIETRQQQHETWSDFECGGWGRWVLIVVIALLFASAAGCWRSMKGKGVLHDLAVVLSRETRGWGKMTGREFHFATSALLVNRVEGLPSLAAL
jgi:hypothetical protein